MLQTSKTMRTAVEKADAVVQARGGILFTGGAPERELNGLNAWCKVRVLRPKDCRLERKGAERLAKAIARFLSAYLVGLFLEGNCTQEDGGRSLANTLRLNITLASLNLRFNGPGEGGMRELAETLRLNTTLKSLNLRENGLGEGGGRALAEALRLNTTLKSLNLGCNILGEGGGRALTFSLTHTVVQESFSLSQRVSIQEHVHRKPRSSACTRARARAQVSF